MPKEHVLTLKNTMIYVFNGERNHFPSAVFSSKENAEKWINEYRLVGTLTAYPLDVSVYDWVIKRDLWKPSREDQKTAKFIANFSSAYTGHDHYTGEVEAEDS